ncbi:class I SAM-dependent methyltransferase [bacterium]|nr:class I SAM-dependent methyltransferase [bacterium]
MQAAVKDNTEQDRKPTTPSVNVEALMAEIREKIKRDLEQLPTAAPTIQLSQNRAANNPVILSEELNYLNSHWHDWAVPSEISSHRPIIGRLIVKFKKFFVNMIWNTVLGEYFERERKFQSNLVRFLNQTARYIDARDTDVWTRIIQKIDRDVNQLLREDLERLHGEMRSLGRELVRTESLRVFEDRIEGLRDELHALERTTLMIARAKINTSETPAAMLQQGQDQPTSFEPSDLEYLVLEDRYRGSEHLIRERMREYLHFFSNATAEVLEFGCGRGEFLELLKASGIPAIGIDLNPAMTEICKTKGLNVVTLDCIKFLEQLPNNSAGGIFAAQLVEHLPRKVLEKFFELAHAKLKPGARLILETINPESFTALASNFFRDPTHIWPLHPETLKFMAEIKGFNPEQILYSSPYPKEAMLKELILEEYLPARFMEAIDQLNENLRRLNKQLYGFQDFAIVVKK